MMRKRKWLEGAFGVIAILALGSSGLAGCSSASQVEEYQADYPAYDSVSAALAVSDVVVAGEVLRSESRELRPETSDSTDPTANPQAGVPQSEVAEIDPIITTVSTIRVTEALKGDVRVGDEIEVKQLGGTLNGVKAVEGSTTVMRVGSEYGLLLVQYEGSPFSTINPEEGLYSLQSGEQVRRSAPVSGKVPTWDDVRAAIGR